MTAESDISGLVDGHPRERRVPFADLGIGLAEVARDLGYRNGVMPGAVRAAVDRAMEEAADCIAAAAVWVPRPARWDGVDATLSVDGTEFAVGEVIGAHMEGVIGVALFVVSIGESLEARARAMMKDGQMMEGYALDAVGSAAADACAAWVEKDIRAAAEGGGWRATSRLSPGYCGWATSEQQRLFSLLPDRPCGVRLTPSSLMMPIKSVSGIVGLGPDVEQLDYACGMCDRVDCFRRTTGPGANH